MLMNEGKPSNQLAPISYFLPETVKIKENLELTYCWRAVLHTAIKAAMKPLLFTLTSVTVQTPTPIRTTTILSFVSLEYRMLSNTISNRHSTGIILNFAIWEFRTTNYSFSLRIKMKHLAHGLYKNQEKKHKKQQHFYLIKSHRVPHKANIHADNWKVSECDKF